MKACILTIIKDEQLYIENFIKYHIDLGINHIFLFEDFNSTSHKDIISKYKNVTLNNISMFKNNMILTSGSDPTRQTQYNKNALTWIKENYDYDWCFAIDCDEYITLQNNTIESILSQYSDYDAVAIQWQNYNANGHITKPDYDKESIVDIYTTPCEYSPTDTIIKSTKVVYNMHTFISLYFAGCHMCSKYCKWCRTNFTTDKLTPSYDNIYIRHYLTKSWEEYVWKLKTRGMFHPTHRGFDEFFELNPDLKSKKQELLKWTI